ncbi:hypothetical protein Cadr_000019978 [Camelus dromedarius]|uniref:Uncharacterized protein n=1 Tax=Camelus dromedarius TaxID=9838 RepID=A0A5N4D230_CAMDR|nr:hypothetical protein Cadr_000019978 [Camelus dromedarius]
MSGCTRRCRGLAVSVCSVIRRAAVTGSGFLVNPDRKWPVTFPAKWLHWGAAEDCTTCKGGNLGFLAGPGASLRAECRGLSALTASLLAGPWRVPGRGLGGRLNVDRRCTCFQNELQDCWGRANKRGQRAVEFTCLAVFMATRSRHDTLPRSLSLVNEWGGGAKGRGVSLRGLQRREQFPRDPPVPGPRQHVRQGLLYSGAEALLSARTDRWVPTDSETAGGAPVVPQSPCLGVGKRSERLSGRLKSPRMPELVTGLFQHPGPLQDSRT